MRNAYVFLLLIIIFGCTTRAQRNTRIDATQFFYLDDPHLQKEKEYTLVVDSMPDNLKEAKFLRSVQNRWDSIKSINKSMSPF